MTASTRGRNNRIRGQRGEREAVTFLREHGVGCEDRLLGQERDGGYDLDTEAGPCEVKRRKKLPAYMIPREGVAFVMARQDYGRWYVVEDADRWASRWLRDMERTRYAVANLPFTEHERLRQQVEVLIQLRRTKGFTGCEHPGYMIGQHPIIAAYERICLGEDEAEVMADFGWVREDAASSEAPCNPARVSRIVNGPEVGRTE